MGHAHGIAWNDKMIEEEIFKCMKSLNIDRMPSRSEVEMVTSNTALSNKISKTGGYYEWAKKLNIKIKDSETCLGLEYEHKFNNFMLELGYSSLVTTIKAPYDVLVEGGTKIDVKVSKGYNNANGFSFSFNLESKIPKCDFYAFYCINDKQTKLLIVPSNVMTGKKQLSIGLTSKYDCYIDQFGLINDHIEFIAQLKKHCF